MNSKFKKLRAASEPMEKSRKKYGIAENPPFPSAYDDPLATDAEIAQNAEFERTRVEWIASHTKSESKRAKRVIKSWGAHWKGEM